MNSPFFKLAVALLFLTNPTLITADETVTLSPSADAYVDESQPTTNFGSQSLLFAGPQGSTGNNMDLQFFIMFDLSAYSGETVLDARLELYVQRSAGVVLKGSVLTSSWNENTVTWNTSPFDAGAFGNFNTSGNPVTIDITQQVKDWISGSVTNYGIQVRSDFNQGTSNNFWGFYSKEWSTQSQRPKLIITFQGPNYSVYDASWSNSNDIDGDGYSSYRKLEFDVDVDDGSTRSVYAKIWYKLASSSTFNLYFTTPDFTITGNSGSDVYAVDVGSPNSELSHNLYDFEIHVYESGGSSPVAFRRRSDDSDLYHQNFETSSEDNSSGGDVIFEDNFDDGNYNDWTYSSQAQYSWDVNNGNLRANGGAATGNNSRRNAIHPINNINAGDGVFEFDLLKETDSGYYPSAVIYFCDDNTNWDTDYVGYNNYLLSLNPTGNGNTVTTSKFVNGNSVGSSHLSWQDGTVPDQYYTMNSNQWYHIKIIKNGTSIKIYRDSELLQSVIDISGSPFPKGNIGFVKQNCVWRFDNVVASSVTSIQDKINNIPYQYSLLQNYPNPFNSNTVIHFSVPKQSKVTLKIFDVLGKEIETLIDKKLNAGEHKIKWNAKGSASGIYLYKLQAGSFTKSKKLLLIK